MIVNFSLFLFILSIFVLSILRLLLVLYNLEFLLSVWYNGLLYFLINEFLVTKKYLSLASYIQVLCGVEITR